MRRQRRRNLKSTKKGRALCPPLWLLLLDLLHFKALQGVANLDVAVLLHSDAALIALGDILHVILEPAQRIDGEVVLHHVAVAYQAGLAVAAHHTLGDVRTGDVAPVS